MFTGPLSPNLEVNSMRPTRATVQLFSEKLKVTLTDQATLEEQWAILCRESVKASNAVKEPPIPKVEKNNRT